MRKIIFYILNLPLYYLSLLIPKSKNIWVFGAWFGKQYSDNSKELFEYVSLHDKNIKAIWLTDSDDIINEVRKKGFFSYKKYSLKGYYYSILAKYIFVSTGMADVNKYVTTTKYKIQLWHGTPLKKIQDDVKKINVINHFQKFKQIIFPFNVSKYEYMTIPSTHTGLNFKTAFSNIEHFEITGYPRNDLLQYYTDIKKVIYLPTHRGEGSGSIDEIFKTFNIDELNKKLKNLDLELIVKMHYYDLSRVNFEDKSNIKFLKENKDVYELLQQSSILITDYSSVYFDFLLTNRPLIFTPFDIEEYQKNDRDFYYNYDEVTPGPKCKDWDEVIDWIEKFKKDSTLYSIERKKTNKMFNQYSDFKNCERVYKLIKERCDA